MIHNIAIVGSREYPSPAPIEAYVAELPVGTVIVSGGARGVDSWAAEAARAHGLKVTEFLADWERHGRGAGPKRNAEIVEAADELVAFWDGRSRGTLNSVALAVRKGIPASVIGPAGSVVPLDEAMAAAESKGITKAIARSLQKPSSKA